MALDMFLYFDAASTIEGETKDKVYSTKNAIDVLAWSWGMSQSGTFHGGGGGGAGKANFQDISVTKYIDKGTPNLMFAVATGKHIGEANLIVRKAGGVQENYIHIKMTDVMVTSLSTGGSGGEDRLTENVTLNFAKVQFGYAPQDKTGKVSKFIDFTYNIAENSKE